MPHIKNALIRYRIIDRMIRNPYKPYPSKGDLREACEESLFGSTYGEHICDSTIEKDLFAMRMEHDAPIKYSRKHEGYFYEDPEYTINDIPLSEDELDSIRFAVQTLQQVPMDKIPMHLLALKPPMPRLVISGYPYCYQPFKKRKYAPLVMPRLNLVLPNSERFSPYILKSIATVGILFPSILRNPIGSPTP
jgi:hypothetical protein